MSHSSKKPSERERKTLRYLLMRVFNGMDQILLLLSGKMMVGVCWRAFSGSMCA